MSGIFGVFFRDGRPVESELLEQMLQSLAHRGPDGEGLWKDGAVGLGHLMLHTTPESLQEKLPFIHQSGDLVITADARIDNRDELFGLLDLGGRPRAEVADSELILAAYERWGEDCPEKLIGDFAFVIWDKREQKLFCARDHIGVRLLVYFISDRVFVCATEIKAILQLAEVPRRLNELKVADYLVKNFEDKASTFYRDICRLPAAHRMVVSDRGTRIERYWAPDLSYSLKYPSDAAYADAFREHFMEAVRCRLRSAFPVGSMLSGGLDTSSIVGVAHHLLSADERRPLHTFSAIFPDLAEVDPRIDERSFINAVLENGDLEPHFVRADRLSPLDAMLWQEDEPIGAPNLYLEHAIYGEAKQAGARIILSGFDGDSTVSHGYELLPELIRTVKWRTLNAEVTALAGSMGVRRRRILWHGGVKPLLPQQAVDIFDSLQYRNRPSSDSVDLINSDFARRIGLDERTKSFEVTSSFRRYSVREKHWQDLGSGLLQYALEKMDLVAAVNLVDVRLPFFDRRLIEFCLALPPEQKLRGGVTRVVFRKAMADFIPRKVLSRVEKGDLSANFKTGLLEKERIVLEKVIWQDIAFIENYVDVGAIQSAYRRFESQPLQREQDALNIFLVFVLSRWLEGCGLAQ